MNKESLLERLKLLEDNETQLKQQIQNAQANLIAIDGAKQDCNHWLQVIEEKETEKKSKKVK